MADNNRTKNMCANALLELSNTKALADISISDITNFCGISRNTFYYHFKDKQELIYWIYATFHDTKIDLRLNSEQSNTMALVNFMRKYASFFKQAFSETGQNCFREELTRSCYKDYSYIIHTLYDATDLTPEIADFIAQYYARSLVETAELFLYAQFKDIHKVVEVYTLIQSKGLEGTLQKLREPGQ